MNVELTYYVYANNKLVDTFTNLRLARACAFEHRRHTYNIKLYADSVELSLR